MTWILLVFILEGPNYDLIRDERVHFKTQKECELASAALTEIVNKHPTQSGIIGCAPTYLQES